MAAPNAATGTGQQLQYIHQFLNNSDFQSPPPAQRNGAPRSSQQAEAAKVFAQYSQRPHLWARQGSSRSGALSKVLAIPIAGCPSEVVKTVFLIHPDGRAHTIPCEKWNKKKKKKKKKKNKKKTSVQTEAMRNDDRVLWGAIANSSSDELCTWLGAEAIKHAFLDYTEEQEACLEGFLLSLLPKETVNELKEKGACVGPHGERTGLTRACLADPKSHLLPCIPVCNRSQDPQDKVQFAYVFDGDSYYFATVGGASRANATVPTFNAFKDMRTGRKGFADMCQQADMNKFLADLVEYAKCSDDGRNGEAALKNLQFVVDHHLQSTCVPHISSTDYEYHVTVAFDDEFLKALTHKGVALKKSFHVHVLPASRARRSSKTKYAEFGGQDWVYAGCITFQTTDDDTHMLDPTSVASFVSQLENA